MFPKRYLETLNISRSGPCWYKHVACRVPWRKAPATSMICVGDPNNERKTLHHLSSMDDDVLHHVWKPPRHWTAALHCHQHDLYSPLRFPSFQTRANVWRVIETSTKGSGVEGVIATSNDWKHSTLPRFFETLRQDALKHSTNLSLQRL